MADRVENGREPPAWRFSPEAKEVVAIFASAVAVQCGVIVLWAALAKLGWPRKRFEALADASLLVIEIGVLSFGVYAFLREPTRSLSWIKNGSNLWLASIVALPLLGIAVVTMIFLVLLSRKTGRKIAGFVRTGIPRPRRLR